MDGMLYTVSGGIQWMGCCTQLMGAFNGWDAVHS